LRPSTRWDRANGARICGLSFAVAVAAVALVGCDAASTQADPLRSPSAPATPQSSALPPSSAVIDSCLVGTWREVSNESNLNLTGAGGARARVRGAGRTLTFRADGTEFVDYGGGVRKSGRSADGVLVEQTITGTVEYRVSTRDGILSFLLLADDTKIEYRSGGRVVAEGTFGESSPVSYTCVGDTHTQAQDSGYRAEYRRA
jgi:hypothetical protein